MPFADLLLPWGGTLSLTAAGTFATVTDLDYVDQRIVRNVLTNSAVPLPDGSTTPPDYPAHPEYGLSGGALVDEAISDDTIAAFKERVVAAVLGDTAVDQSVLPQTVVTQPAPGALVISVTFSTKTSSEPVQITLASGVPS